MLNIVAIPDGILYREKLSVWIRLFIIVIGVAVGVMIPVVWIGLADWSTFSLTTAFAALVVVVTAAMGLLFVGIALSGVTTLHFDATRRILIRKTRGPLQRRQSRIPFEQIERFETFMRDSEDGPYPVVQVFIAGEKRPIEMVNLGDRASADAWREKLEKLTAHLS